MKTFARAKKHSQRQRKRRRKKQKETRKKKSPSKSSSTCVFSSKSSFFLLAAALINSHRPTASFFSLFPFFLTKISVSSCKKKQQKVAMAPEITKGPSKKRKEIELKKKYHELASDGMNFCFLILFFSSGNDFIGVSSH